MVHAMRVCKVFDMCIVFLHVVKITFAGSRGFDNQLPIMPDVRKSGFVLVFSFRKVYAWFLSVCKLNK